jgi:ABC-type Fe3+ transport system substrate-binding protein
MLFVGRSGALARLCGVLAVCLWVRPGVALAADGRVSVQIITSYAQFFYEPFRVAFERKEPRFRLRIVNRNTAAAMMQVATGHFRDADVFWASSPDAFETLKAQGLLAPLDLRVDTRERDVGGYPLDDPDGTYRGFAIAGYGMVWNAGKLAQAGVPAPGAIADLADPRYRGLVAMSSPSRSGTTHLMVETVLQRYGWERGWALWRRIAGNLATITARSFTVTNGVADGRFGVGLSVDPKRRAAGAAALDYAYPDENVFLPASIALLKGAREPDGGRAFIAYVLSPEGQALLAHPDIRRQPLSRETGRQVSPQDDLFAAAQARAQARFDATLSGRRYELVNILFDELITERLARLQRFWRRMDRLRALSGDAPAAQASLREIEEVALRLPDPIAAFDRSPPSVALRRLPRGAPPDADQAALMESVRQAAETSLAAAERAQEAALGAFEPQARPERMAPP